MLLAASFVGFCGSLAIILAIIAVLVILMLCAPRDLFTWLFCGQIWIDAVSGMLTILVEAIAHIGDN